MRVSVFQIPTEAVVNVRHFFVRYFKILQLLRGSYPMAGRHGFQEELPPSALRPERVLPALNFRVDAEREAEVLGQPEE